MIWSHYIKKLSRTPTASESILLRALPSRLSNTELFSIDPWLSYCSKFFLMRRMGGQEGGREGFFLAFFLLDCIQLSVLMSFVSKQHHKEAQSCKGWTYLHLKNLVQCSLHTFRIHLIISVNVICLQAASVVEHTRKFKATVGANRGWIRRF